MKRSGSRQKFLMCFRPVVEMEDCILDDGFGLHKSKSAALLSINQSDSQAFLISAAGSDEFSDSFGKKGTLDRSVSDYSAFVGDRRSVSSAMEEVVAAQPPNHHRSKRFSRAIKAALFDSVLSKRANNTKSWNRVADESNRGSSLIRMNSMDKEQCNSIRKVFEGRWEAMSSSSSSSSSSLASSASLPNLCSGSDSETPSQSSSVARRVKTRQSEQSPNPNQKQFGSLTACLLLLVSLGVTILGGKFLGVALTLICLYSLPRRRQDLLRVFDPLAGEARTSREENRVSREYKKQRVVMEGMLKRNHRSYPCLNRPKSESAALQQSK
ncbi:unnamed protein product [Linum trigynum]|uniref:Uncharacterized protein n=1 Tax=Linum trigynum TaxID=586398 RepID=A0AAV2F6P5_9ROSI